MECVIRDSLRVQKVKIASLIHEHKFTSPFITLVLNLRASIKGCLMHDLFFAENNYHNRPPRCTKRKRARRPLRRTKSRRWRSELIFIGGATATIYEKWTRGGGGVTDAHIFMPFSPNRPSREGVVLCRALCVHLRNVKNTFSLLAAAAGVCMC
jgi:hypothetical protein